MEDDSKIQVSWSDKIFNVFLYFIGLALVIFGIFLLGSQIFNFLKSGVWNEIPLVGIMAYAPDKIAAWVFEPQSWLGLHKIIISILNFLPLSLTSAFVGFGLIAISTQEYDS